MPILLVGFIQLLLNNHTIFFSMQMILKPLRYLRGFSLCTLRLKIRGTTHRPSTSSEKGESECGCGSVHPKGAEECTQRTRKNGINRGLVRARFTVVYHIIGLEVLCLRVFASPQIKQLHFSEFNGMRLTL